MKNNLDISIINEDLASNFSHIKEKNKKLLSQINIYNEIDINKLFDLNISIKDKVYLLVSGFEMTSKEQISLCINIAKSLSQFYKDVKYIDDINVILFKISNDELPIDEINNLFICLKKECYGYDPIRCFLRGVKELMKSIIEYSKERTYKQDLGVSWLKSKNALYEFGESASKSKQIENLFYNTIKDFFNIHL